MGKPTLVRGHLPLKFSADNSHQAFNNFGGGNILEKGNIKVEENTITGNFGVDQNRVGGNIQIFKNRGPANKTVALNNVREDLQCFENQLPFLGGPNTARKAQGQCFIAP